MVVLFLEREGGGASQALVLGDGGSFLERERRGEASISLGGWWFCFREREEGESSISLGGWWFFFRERGKGGVKH